MSLRMRGLLLLIAALVLALAAVWLRQVQIDSDLKVQWVRYLTSRSGLRTTQALDELRARGWQHDPTLHNLDLSNANFVEADLSGFDLSGSNFYAANLRQADLRGAVLQGANFQQAALLDADLDHADLRGAILRDAYMTGSDLEGALLEGAEFGPYTLLPSYIYWTSGIDMSQFTDPAHPNFWRSTYDFSPAYDSQATPDAEPPGTLRPTPTVGP